MPKSTVVHGWAKTPLRTFDTYIRGIATAQNGVVFVLTNIDCWKINTSDHDIKITALYLQSAFAINAITCNDTNELYFATKSGLMKYIIEKNELTCVPLEKKDKGSDIGLLFGTCEAMVIDKNNLYATIRHAISKVDLEEVTIQRTWSGNTLFGYKNGKLNEALFNSPSGIAVGKDGTLYVTERIENRVRAIKDGRVTTCINGKYDQILKLNQPCGVAVGQNGDLYVCDHKYLKIFKLGGSKIIVKAKFELDTKSSAKTRASHVAVDGAGTIFLAAGNTLWKFMNVWQTARWLWIGNLKEDSSYCLLATVPKDVIKEISRHLIT